MDKAYSTTEYQSGHVVKLAVEEQRAPDVYSKPLRYSGTNFMEALGDSVSRELLAATDWEIKRIVKMFDAVIYSGKQIDPNHAEAQKAFDYLVQSADIPSFDAAKKQQLCEPKFS